MHIDKHKSKHSICLWLTTRGVLCSPTRNLGFVVCSHCGHGGLGCKPHLPGAEFLSLESSGADGSFSFLSSRPAEPPQPVNSEAPSAAPSQPHVVPSPLVCQLPQQELTDQSAEPNPRSSSSTQRPGHHTRVRSASGQLGAKQQRATGDSVSTCPLL